VDIGSGNTAPSDVPLTSSGGTISVLSGSFTPLGTVSGGTWKTTGAANVAMTGESLSLKEVNGSGAHFVLSSGVLSVPSGASSIGTLSVTGGTLETGSELDVTSSLTISSSPTLDGSGRLVVKPGATGTLGSGECSLDPTLSKVTFVNEGTVTMGASGGTRDGALVMGEGAQLDNKATFNDDSFDPGCGFGYGGSTIFNSHGTGEPQITNTGTFRSDFGSGNEGKVIVNFANYGSIVEVSGKLVIEHPVVTKESSSTFGGPENPSTPGHPCPICGEPVVAATGDLVEEQTDLSVGGRGVGLDLTRTYNSQAAAAGSKGIFGYGWSSSFSDHLVVEKEAKKATLVQADGATVPFTESGSSWVAPIWSQDKLAGSAEAGYTLTLPNQTQYKLQGSSGRLESIIDRNGNETKLAYNETTHLLETMTDPSGRKLTLKENAEGLVESANDPAGHEVKYTYESGSLATVTLPGEEKARWSFKYDGSHQLTELTDGRGGKTLNEYNSSHQVTLQTDPLKRELKFEYEAFQTKITNKATGAVTLEQFTSNDEPFAITRGDGTSLARILQQGV
jgi:YD repeat-containing protein